RGMLSTIYARLTREMTWDQIRQYLMDAYKDRFFIRILPQGQFPSTAHVRGTNFCDIGFWIDEKSERIIIVSAIDNILKGASGQAVQNMNIMFHIDEKTGLDMIPGAI
ncbi:MAG: N-acetyl-gamma-glutamyl-phosphate reductase, partial [Desulfamplus sp.]|nr:N-acetyl-gamma-glutamyl-phosphate reductase [Desulfamplus sp.]